MGLLMSLGSLLLGKAKDYLIPLIIGAVAVLSVWLAWGHYQGVLEDRAKLRVQVEQLEATNAQLKITQKVFEERVTETATRSEDIHTIKRELYEIPPTDDVPADIRHALDRLRDRAGPKARHP